MFQAILQPFQEREELETKAILKYVRRLRTRLINAGSRQKAEDEVQLRAELFSSKQMRKHGKTIASAHKLGRGRTANRLLKRLTDNENVLFDVREKLTQAVVENRRMTP